MALFESRFHGLELFNVSISMGAPEKIMLKQFRSVAKEVRPRFTRR